MFGNDNNQHNDQSSAPAQDTGYLGSLESPIDSTDAPQNDVMGAPVPNTTLGDTSSSSQSSGTGDATDLVALKQKALQQLSPLVGHLDQTPEEKFRTTMMMIQASDNQDLLPKAFEAANQIPDEKAKAQALLDVINEINYFTQQK